MSLEANTSNTLNIRACRICLDTKYSEDAILEDGSELLEAFEYCVGITLKSQDTPRKVCLTCANNIKNYATFKQLCHKSDRLWKNVIISEIKCYTDNVFKDTIKVELNVDTDEKPYNDDELFNELEYKDVLHIDVRAIKNECNDYNEIEGEVDKETVTQKIYKYGKNPMKKKKCFQCDVCGKRYITKISIMRHLDQYHGLSLGEKKQNLSTSMWYCGLCEKETDNYQEITEHLKEHWTSNDSSCKLCNYNGKDVAAILTHRYTHQLENYNKKMFCHICSKKCASNLTLEYHYRSVHLNKVGGLCSICDKEFNSFKTWRNHERWHKSANYICDLCGKKFLFKNSIKTHINEHFNIRPYICETCGKRFKRMSYLKIHIENVHYTQGRVKCGHCDKTFKSESGLKLHMKYAMAEKKYCCEICSKAFPTSKTFESHMFWHSDEKPYACEMCNNRYKAKSQLKIHVRKHTGQRPYKCQNCDSAFPTLSQLNRHTSNHTGVRKHKCRFCEKSYHDKGRLRIHCNSKHGDQDLKSEKT